MTRHVILVEPHQDYVRLLCSCKGNLPVANTYSDDGDMVTLDELNQLAHEHIVAEDGPSPKLECTCLPYSAGGDGPEVDCPVHGDPEHDPLCTCGHPQSEHGTGPTACIVEGNGWFGFADECLAFTPA